MSEDNLCHIIYVAHDINNNQGESVCVSLFCDEDVFLSSVWWKTRGRYKRKHCSTLKCTNTRLFQLRIMATIVLLIKPVLVE